MNKMRDNDIEQVVLKLLESTYPNGLTYGDITQRIGDSRKYKTSISQTLAGLCQKGKLVKERKRYKLLSPPLSPTSGKKRSMPTATTASAKQNPNLIEGTFDATSLSRNYSYAFVRTPETDYFIDSEDILNAYHGDTVMIEPRQRRGKSTYGVIRRIVKRNNEEIPGDIARANNAWIFLPSNPKIHNWFEIRDVAGAVESDKVILKVSDWGNPVLGKKPSGVVLEILGKSGDPQVELLAVIRQYKLPLAFPDDVNEEVQRIPVEIPQEVLSRRKDLRDLYTFTIDPASAKDFDDAVSIQPIDKGWRLWVHIADVAHYLPLGSKTFIEASKRGNSFYFPKKVIPMIP
ncbi:MAG TPA: RNB domain-containing ribonuclease, partial [Candidatus Cloacimonadota bacterium]|nr:RNB domain-containing ribonuclease [Candidatus Cloacimonadota bacterium]